jgi:hypothetical protein
MGKKTREELEEELDIEEEGDEDEDGAEDGDDEGGEDDEEDRGDELHPEETEKNLKKVAGDDDEDEETDEDEPEDGGKKSRVVPHARFHEVNESLKAEREARLRLEEELARARGASGAGKKADADDGKAKFDIDAKEAEYADALMEGDKDKALAIRKEINSELRRQAKEEAAEQAVQEVSTQAARNAFQAAVSETIAEFPFLDSKSKKANADAIAEVVEWRDFYITKGNSPADALRKAAAKVGPQYAPKKKAADPDEGDDEGDDEDLNAKKLAELRRKNALRRNADSANRQPAAPTGGTGERSSSAKLNPEDMSESEWEKLPEKVKKQLRGDNL